MIQEIDKAGKFHEILELQASFGRLLFFFFYNAMAQNY